MTVKKILLLLLIIIFIFSCKGENEIIEEKEENGIVKDNTTDIENNNEEENTPSYVDKRFEFEIYDGIDETELNQHMEDLFVGIEEKIAMGDYEAWYYAISSEYKNYLDNKKVLAKISKDAYILSSKNIVLKSPKDYFVHVVMKSRSGRVLKYSDYEYIDQSHVKVISTMLDGSKEFVYNFIYEDGSWKLDR